MYVSHRCFFIYIYIYIYIYIERERERERERDPYFLVWNEFHPTSCFLSSSLGKDIGNTTSWINIVSHHKPWEILFIIYLPHLTCFSSTIYIVWTAWRWNTQCDITKKSYSKYVCPTLSSYFVSYFLVLYFHLW
jgi:hypothetical protein